jgi:UDP-N-acetyl-2-amino-2-deoxyglucuronate dehydrogenase
MIRLAIVGAGWAGERQTRAAAELGSRVSVTCLADNDGPFVAQKARELGILRTCTSFEDVLARPDVDAVSLCTPHAQHCEQAVAAARAGKHVLVEKPMALSVADAGRMIDAAAAAGVRLYVAESECYTPRAHWLADAVGERALVGEVVAAAVLNGFRSELFRYPGRREWLTRPELGGTGTWTLHGIHSMAEVRRVLGEVRTVYLREHHAASFATPEIEGTMSGHLTMASGLGVSVMQSCESRAGGLGGWLLFGTRGTVHAGADGYRLLSADGEPAAEAPYPARSLSPYAEEITAFADWIETGVPGPTTAESERHTLAIIEAGYESARTGKPIDLDTLFDRHAGAPR